MCILKPTTIFYTACVFSTYRRRRLCLVFLRFFVLHILVFCQYKQICVSLILLVFRLHFWFFFGSLVLATTWSNVLYTVSHKRKEKGAHERFCTCTCRERKFSFYFYVYWYLVDFNSQYSVLRTILYQLVLVQLVSAHSYLTCMQVHVLVARYKCCTARKGYNFVRGSPQVQGKEKRRPTS